MILYCLYARKSNEEDVKLDDTEEIGTETEREPSPKRPLKDVATSNLKGKKEKVKDSQIDAFHAKLLVLAKEKHALEKQLLQK